jgi:hypothetical protein
MFREPSPDRIVFLRSLPAIDAVRHIIQGDFVPGEEEYLIESILDRAHVCCDEDEMWEILYAAMDEETDPMTVLGRLAQ